MLVKKMTADSLRFGAACEEDLDKERLVDLY